MEVANMSEPPVSSPAETAGDVADEVKTTTCYMCACRCGIRVYLKNGTVRYIEGNPNHPVNKGVLCAKGAAGIMQHYSPARLSKPLLRVGERGSGDFKEIKWDEALTIATKWLGDIRESDPKKLAFFTGRDQSQSLTAWWSQQFGTINHAAHGGFCSVNMAAAGLYSVGGSFWEFGEPDWDLTRYFLMFGVAEDHDSNPIKAGLGKLKTRGDAKFVSVNPIRTGYSAIADEWVGVRPGTDGLFVFALIHELLKAEQIDWDYLARYTNATWLVIQDPGAEDDGLFLLDPDSGQQQCFDLSTKSFRLANDPQARPAMMGSYESASGRRVVPAFQLLVERYLDPKYAPQAVAERIGIEPAQIKRIAAEIAAAAFENEITLDVSWTDWTGKKHDKITGRPVAMHAMRGVSAHTNGFHTCRAIHLLQMLLGSIDVPGGFRYKPPFPKHVPPGQKPARDPGQSATPLSGMPLGFPASPDDLLVDEAGKPQRIDKAFSWEFPLAIHGMMHMVIHNAWKGDPYRIDTLFMYMANMAWNSSMNTSKTIDYLTDKDPDSGEYRIPHIIYSDAYYSETVAYSDLILPDTTYLERWDCISLLDRPIGDADGAADAIRQPVVEPDRDVRCFQEVLLNLGARLGLPGMVNADGGEKFPDGYADYIANHMRTDKVGPLAGWRGESGDQQITGPANPDQLSRYIDNGCFWRQEFSPSQRYYKFANREYLDFAHEAGWIGRPEPIVMQIYSEPLQKFRLAGRGHWDTLPPETERARLETYFDPLPIWYEPFSESDANDASMYPIHALTQRPMHMYHSWGSQNAWLRQITSANVLTMHHDLAQNLGMVDGDWAWVSSPHGKVKVQIACSSGVNVDTVWTWNAIGKRAGSWGLDEQAPEVKKAFLLNHLISELLPAREDGYRYANADPITGQAAWFDLRVSIEKCAADEKAETSPQFPRVKPHQATPSMQISRFGHELKSLKPLAENATHREFIGNHDVLTDSLNGDGEET
jgi:anaerobic selenocysteine-containing dehydrogenase